jgi:hypothetical protein
MKETLVVFFVIIILYRPPGQENSTWSRLHRDEICRILCAFPHTKNELAIDTSSPIRANCRVYFQKALNPSLMHKVFKFPPQVFAHFI